MALGVTDEWNRSALGRGWITYYAKIVYTQCIDIGAKLIITWEETGETREIDLGLIKEGFPLSNVKPQEFRAILEGTFSYVEMGLGFDQTNIPEPEKLLPSFEQLKKGDYKEYGEKQLQQALKDYPPGKIEEREHDFWGGGK